MISLRKTDLSTDFWRPLEKGRLILPGGHCLRGTVTICDAARRIYATHTVHPGCTALPFVVRGAPGWHEVVIVCEVDEGGTKEASDPVRERLLFFVRAATTLHTDIHALTELFSDLTRVLRDGQSEARTIQLGSTRHLVDAPWSRDHAYTLKSTRYFRADVTSGTELWLRTQRDDGSFWDCFHENPSGLPNWFCEALGQDWFRYYNDGRLMARRIPVEADVEFCITDAVYLGWQATGDKAWIRRWLPSLEASLHYTMKSPLRWSRRHALVKRSFCMDSWDFAHPAFCAGDQRCVHPGDPAFLFHGDNSGFYQQQLQLAALHEAAGSRDRAKELRELAARHRVRANALLYRPPNYAHMLPENLSENAVFAIVGNEWERMSLSTGYTINRGLPDSEMARAILDEYQRRRKLKAAESFAEWWTMDPPYSKEQWPRNGPPPGEYMNGGICLIAAGELAKAAFDHGREAYGLDILLRVAELGKQNGGEFAEVYRRLPTNPAAPEQNWEPINLRAFANRGLRHGNASEVPAWTGEADNDMRNLPTGRQRLAGAEFEIIPPETNAGRSVLFIDRGSAPVKIPVSSGLAHSRSFVFLHATAVAQPRHTPVAIYRLMYSDGTEHHVFIRSGREIGHWWDARPEMLAPILHYNSPVVAAHAWSGPNGTWKNTGVFAFSLWNPHPDKSVTAIEISVSPLLARTSGGLLVCAISACDGYAELGIRRFSGGLPLCWALSSVFYGLMNGFVGIEDTSAAFRTVRVSPRFTASCATHIQACLHYPASDTYCMYEAEWNAGAQLLTLDITGSFEELDIHQLVPSGYTVLEVRMGETSLPFDLARVDMSLYCDLMVRGLPLEPLRFFCEPIG